MQTSPCRCLAKTVVRDTSEKFRSVHQQDSAFACRCLRGAPALTSLDMPSW